MDLEQDRDELERLFLGVLAPFTHSPDSEPIPFRKAIARAQAIIYRREIEAVRAALLRVEAALPTEREYAEGQALSEYNLRIASIIRIELARLDRLEAEVDRIVREIG